MNKGNWWETLAMAASFVALWAWWLARQANARLQGGLAANPISPLWNLVLFGAVVVLLLIFVRRLKRVQQALREELGHKPGAGFGFRPPHDGHKNGAPK